MSEDIENLTDEFAVFVKDFNEAKKIFAAKMQVKLKDAFKSFFDQNPNIKGITWAQYTPYFNDGEPCEFTVYDKYFWTEKLATDEDGEKIPFYEMDYYDLPYGFSLKYDKPEDYGITEEEGIRLQDFFNVLDKIDDDIFYSMFGDHVRVIVTAKGIDVEEHEHD